MSIQRPVQSSVGQLWARSQPVTATRQPVSSCSAATAASRPWQVTSNSSTCSGQWGRCTARRNWHNSGVGAGLGDRIGSELAGDGDGVHRRTPSARTGMGFAPMGGAAGDRPVNPKGLAPSAASGLDRTGRGGAPPHPPQVATPSPAAGVNPQVSGLTPGVHITDSRVGVVAVGLGQRRRRWARRRSLRAGSHSRTLSTSVA